MSRSEIIVAVTAGAGVKAFFHFVFAIGAPVCRVRSLCNTGIAFVNTFTRTRATIRSFLILSLFLRSIPSSRKSISTRYIPDHIFFGIMANKKDYTVSVAAITAHFSNTYISGKCRLAAYQQLCRELKVDVGSSIMQCKKARS